jgi:hypothetical protein
MQKRHVDTGSEWAEDEEKAVYHAVLYKTPFEDLVNEFPTDRNPKSIRMKLKNHEWEKTNGQRGLRGGNAWVKNTWARDRVTLVMYHDKKIANLRTRRDELYAELDKLRDEITQCERRQQEIVRLHN